MAIETTSGPAVEPLTIGQARQHLRVDLDDPAEDALIASAIVAARTYAENFLRKRLITQTVKITKTGFGGGTMPLPVGPVQSITSLQYKSTTDGSLLAWSASNYQLVKTVTPNRIAPAYGLTWPTPRADFDNVVATVVVGYGDTAEDIPGDIVAAVRLLTAHFYENRQNELAGNMVSKLSLGADRLLVPHALHV